MVFFHGPAGLFDDVDAAAAAAATTDAAAAGEVYDCESEDLYDGLSTLFGGGEGGYTGVCDEVRV